MSEQLKPCPVEDLMQISKYNAIVASLCKRCPNRRAVDVNNLSSLSYEIERHLGHLGWDKTANGWLNVKTGEITTMEKALQLEIDRHNRMA